MVPGRRLKNVDRDRIKVLERENRELRRLHHHLQGGVELLCAGARPATAEIVVFIDEHRVRFDVEPICRVLRENDVKIAPSTYYVCQDLSFPLLAGHVGYAAGLALG